MGRKYKMNEIKYGIFWAMEDWWQSRDYDSYRERLEQVDDMFGDEALSLFWFAQFAKKEYCRSA